MAVKLGSSVKVGKMDSIQFLESTESSTKPARFVNFFKGTTLLSLNEKYKTTIENSLDEENFILELTRHEVHGEDISIIHQPNPKGGPIASLNLPLNNHHPLRVGSSIAKSDLNRSEKAPVILS